MCGMTLNRTWPSPTCQGLHARGMMSCDSGK
jgi:hypothetical protein